MQYYFAFYYPPKTLPPRIQRLSPDVLSQKNLVMTGRHRMSRQLLYVVIGLFLLGFWRSTAAEDFPARVDALIQAAGGNGPWAAKSDDATFLRRVSLDLGGRIPCAAETTAFLNSQDPHKRTQLVDALLASPEYAIRMQDLFHAMLMERRGDHPEWSRFLRESFEANKPWDQLVREILDPLPDQESTRGAAFFHTKRLEKEGQQETDYPGLTRDVGRLFLGADLQCAQCHDHLFIDSYKQVDFQGLLAVLQNTYIRTDQQFPAIGENLMVKKTEFMSVFEKLPLATGPRVPFGKEVEIPTYEKDQEYLVPPDRSKNFLGTPQFRPLQWMSQELPSASNRAFVDNIANRTWFIAMGRGLVNPLDQQHIGNPPSHPELLELLGQEMVARRFDLKSMLRALVLSETYQRASLLPPGSEAPLPSSYRIANEKRLSAEQIMASVFIATGPRELATDQRPDQNKVRVAFVKAFGNVPQEPEVEFSPSLRSSLFVLNDSAILDCLAPQPGNLVDRLLNMSDPQLLVNELYLCVLVRQPTPEEVAEAQDYLSQNAERRQAAIINLTWSLLASTEFCLNH